MSSPLSHSDVTATPEWVQPQTLFVHGTSDVLGSPVRDEFRYLTADLLLSGRRDG